jgi:LPS export ABC transporter protein LptC
MDSLKGNFLAGVLFMLLAVGMTFWGWRLFGDVVSSTVSIGELRADLTLQGVELRSGQNGTLEWTLNAREAEYDTAQEIIALQDPQITYFGRSEEESLIMEARQGEILRTENRARLWPNVTAVSGDIRIESMEMEYFGTEKVVVLSGEVIMTRPGAIVTAARAELDIERETITLTGGVQAHLVQDLLPIEVGGPQ